jgi:hypothetical protein
MIARLRRAFDRCERPVSLCWFGDHVPIMPTVYENFDAPNGEVEYVFWRSGRRNPAKERELHAHGLALGWLRAAGIVRVQRTEA